MSSEGSHSTVVFILKSICTIVGGPQILEMFYVFLEVLNSSIKKVYASACELLSIYNIIYAYFW